MTKEKKFYIIISSLIAFLTLTVIVLGLYGYFTLSQKQASNAENQYYTEKISEKKQILESLKARYAEIEPDLPLIDIALPSEKDSSKLLSDLDALSQESKLKLIYLEPDSSGSKSSKSSKKSGGDLSLLQTVKGTTGYELPIEIRVQGSYKNFLVFVKKIEDYQRLINIESIKVPIIVFLLAVIYIILFSFYTSQISNIVLYTILTFYF